MVKDYTETTYKLDRRYRYFYFYFDSMEDTAPFEKLRELVENIYTNEYLNKITVNWNNEFADADGETGLVKQKISSQNTSTIPKTVLLYLFPMPSDMRWLTLCLKNCLLTKNVPPLSLLCRVYFVIHAFGYGFLLPHRNIEYADNFDVLVDGKVCASTEQREAILQEYKINSKCVQYDSLKTMKQADLRSIFTGQDVVYVYHNQIDARGDKAASENEVFTACEEAIEEIYSMIKKIASQANTLHFIVTADHGFIYKRDKIQATDKISGAASKSNSVGQRYSISAKGLDADGVCSTTVGKVLGNKDERIISFPLASDIFKVAGAGQNYVHGGCSPQEMLIPLLDVKVDKGKKETSSAEIALVSLTQDYQLITTLDFVQTEPVSDVVKETTYEFTSYQKTTRKFLTKISLLLIKKTRILQSVCSDCVSVSKTRSTTRLKGITWLHTMTRTISKFSVTKLLWI